LSDEAPFASRLDEPASYVAGDLQSLGYSSALRN
jgi:hypothetical protein